MENNKQIFNLKVSELENIIGKVLEDKLNKRPIEYKKKISEKLLTLIEITQIFKISKPTVYKWQRLDFLPKPIKIGGKIYYYKNDIEQMITKKKGMNDE